MNFTVVDSGNGYGSPVKADQIPVAHTPTGGYGIAFPAPILADCTEPLAVEVPDLRGMWRFISATRGGQPMPADDRLMSCRERIEQCGNRIVDRGGGRLPMRAPGARQEIRPIN